MAASYFEDRKIISTHGLGFRVQGDIGTDFTLLRALVTKSRDRLSNLLFIKLSRLDTQSMISSRGPREIRNNSPDLLLKRNTKEPKTLNPNPQTLNPKP